MLDLSSSIQKADFMVFDLDRTLYAGDNFIFTEMELKIRDYLGRHHGVNRDKAEDMRLYYQREYGTTLSGLLAESNVDPHHYLEEVHDLDHSYLSVDPELDRLLSLYNKPKLIFTNGPLKHAQRTLSSLGISHHFEHVFDIIAADFQPKPQLTSYQKFIAATQVLPEKCIFFEDCAQNLLPAAELGMTTVWIESNHACTLQTREDSRIHFRVACVKSALRTVSHYATA